MGGVNYMSDLKDLKDFGYVQQIPLESLFKNLGYKQQNYNEAFQKAQQVVDMVGNIPSLGQDTQKKQEIMDNVNKELSKFAGQDLREGNVQSSLNGFIGQVLGGKDLQNMAARATKYTQDQKTYHELQKAGKSVPMWMQTSLNQANQYYGSGVYDPEARFTGEIQVAPDFTAKHKSLIDMVKPQKDWVFKDGYWHEMEGVSKDRLSNAFYQNYTSDPESREYYDKLFDATYADTNWDMEKEKIYAEHKKNIMTAKINAAYLGNTADVERANQDLQELEQAHSSANAANFFKQTAKNDFLKGQATNDASAYSWYSNPEIKVDEYSKLNAEQSKELSVAKAKELLERGIDPRTGKALTYTDEFGTTLEVGGVGSKQNGSSRQVPSPKEKQFYTEIKSKEFDDIIANGKGAKSTVLKIFPNYAGAYDNFITKSDGIWGVTAADTSVDPPIPASEELLVTKDDYIAHALKYLSDADAQEYAKHKKAEELKLAGAAPRKK